MAAHKGVFTPVREHWIRFRGYFIVLALIFCVALPFPSLFVHVYEFSTRTSNNKFTDRGRCCGEAGIFTTANTFGIWQLKRKIAAEIHGYVCRSSVTI